MSFMVYRGGRWRALDLVTGSIEGMHSLEFMVCNDGQAIKMAREEVLKELRRHNSCRPSRVSIGASVECDQYKRQDGKVSLLSPNQRSDKETSPAAFEVPHLQNGCTSPVMKSRFEMSNGMGAPVRFPPPRASARVMASRLSLSSATSNRNALFSEQEDLCLLKWLCEDPERVGKTRGNVLWKELEEVFPSLCGHIRTWHSLRNRFLRSLLPALLDAKSELCSRLSVKRRALLLTKRRSLVWPNSKHKSRDCISSDSSEDEDLT